MDAGDPRRASPKLHLLTTASRMRDVASISDRVGDLGSYLREQREHARLSVRQLAALTGVSNPYLSQIERGLRRPSAEVLQQIARGLRISAEALYVRDGILEENHRIDVQLAVAGPSPAVYAFYRGTTQRNLYRIPIP